MHCGHCMGWPPAFRAATAAPWLCHSNLLPVYADSEQVQAIQHLQHRLNSSMTHSFATRALQRDWRQQGQEREPGSERWRQAWAAQEGGPSRWVC